MTIKEVDRALKIGVRAAYVGADRSSDKALAESYREAAEVLRSLRDRLKEEEEFREAAENWAEILSRPGYRAYIGGAEGAFVDRYRRLIALRAAK